MLKADAERYVLSLYNNFLGRASDSAEFEHWMKFVEDGNAAESVYFAFVNSDECKSKTRVRNQFPPSHYHSAIVDPSTVGEYVNKERRTEVTEMSGIDVPLAEMEDFWWSLSDIIASTPFEDVKK